jgi:hypothetical protein
MRKEVPQVIELEVIPPYTLQVTFKDGMRRCIDLKGRLHGKVFGPLLDPAVFATAYVDPVWRTVAWPNGADLAPEFLYESGEKAE